jgi:hypothetical protein
MKGFVGGIDHVARLSTTLKVAPSFQISRLRQNRHKEISDVRLAIAEDLSHEV